MSLHLQPVPDAVPEPSSAGTIETVFFVLQRQNGHWSPAAKIVTVCEHEDTAEAFAAQQKKLHPHQNFGVAMLRSEAREVASPIEIVRVEGNA
jgi:hypothetical protein